MDSQFDTLIGVYTGSSVSTLTVVTNDNDSGPDLTSRVIFNATSNETYRIAVDGVNGKSGTLVLHWTQSLAPLIVVEPETTNVVANVNENGVFRVTAVGNPLPTYQWRHEGTSITGATNWTHTITNVQVSDAGGYTVVCTNISGSVTSAVASLIVHGDSAARLSLFGLSSNQFRFHIYGLTNRAYRVESSTNLTEPVTWTADATNIVSFWHTNVIQTNFPIRFFRVITNSL